MPETLEERFGRAKSGLMLAPVNTQAYFAVLAMLAAQLEKRPEWARGLRLQIEFRQEMPLQTAGQAGPSEFLDPAVPGLGQPETKLTVPDQAPDGPP
jgi:hypothetical protein